MTLVTDKSNNVHTWDYCQV